MSYGLSSEYNSKKATYDNVGGLLLALLLRSRNFIDLIIGILFVIARDSSYIEIFFCNVNSTNSVTLVIFC